MMKFEFKQRGFSLPELLITIAIIGILSNVVLTQVRGARQRAVNAVIKSDMSQLATQAADLDQLREGSEAGSTCNEVFSNEKMMTLINHATAKAGKPMISAFCSKSTAKYKFAFLSPMVGDDSHYLCVDDQSAVKEVASTNISQIISDYSCDSVASSDAGSGGSGGDTPPSDTGGAGSGDTGGILPIAIVSADYGGYENGASTINITFNQNVSIAGYSPTMYSSVPFYDGGPYSFSANAAMMNDSNTYPYAFTGSPYVCQTASDGTYPAGSYYITFYNVYSVTYDYYVSSVGATINCPSITNFNTP